MNEIKKILSRLDAVCDIAISSNSAVEKPKWLKSNIEKIDELVNKEIEKSEQFEDIFVEIVVSNYLLGKAEYNRNPSYNNHHFHYKAEYRMMQYLRQNNSKLLEKVFSQIKFNELKNL